MGRKFDIRKVAGKKLAAQQELDVAPTLILVVDQNLVIQELNDTARVFLGPEHKNALQKRNGEAFQCTHNAESPAGCGHGRFCQVCPIRDAVAQACQEQRVVRRRTKAVMGSATKSRDVHLLITATPLPSQGSARFLVVMEDISALMALQNPIPVCASCKRVRDDANYWEKVDVHFRQHFDVEISAGVCPDCQKEFYGPLAKTIALRG